MSSISMATQVRARTQRWRDYRDAFAKQNALANSPLALQENKHGSINEFARTIGGLSVELAQVLNIQTLEAAQALDYLVTDMLDILAGLDPVTIASHETLRRDAEELFGIESVEDAEALLELVKNMRGSVFGVA